MPFLFVGTRFYILASFSADLTVNHLVPLLKLWLHVVRLVTGITNLPVRALYPLEYLIDYLSVACPCRAHTKCLCNVGVRCKFVALVFKQRFVTVDSDL